MPEVIRDLLSRSKADSVALSDLVMNGLIDTAELTSLRLLIRMLETSHERVNLTRIGRSRVCSLEYLPSLVLSHIECSDSSGYMDCTIVQTDFTSLAIRACLGVPLGHSLIPYITMLNLRSLADWAEVLCGTVLGSLVLWESLSVFALTAVAYELGGWKLPGVAVVGPWTWEGNAGITWIDLRSSVSSALRAASSACKLWTSTLCWL